MSRPHFFDGDLRRAVPVPLVDLTERELVRIALDLTDPDDTALLTHERTEEILTVVDAVFAEFDRRRGWARP